MRLRIVLRFTRKVPVPVLPADVRESQKIERLGLAFSSLFPVLFGKPPELNPARFVWVQFQPKLPQPFPEIFQETVCFGLVLESEDIVIRVSDDNHVASRALLAPGVHPEVEYIMQIDIRKQSAKSLNLAEYPSPSSSIRLPPSLRPSAISGSAEGSGGRQRDAGRTLAANSCRDYRKILECRRPARSSPSSA